MVLYALSLQQPFISYGLFILSAITHEQNHYDFSIQKYFLVTASVVKLVWVEDKWVEETLIFLEVFVPSSQSCSMASYTLFGV